VNSWAAFWIFMSVYVGCEAVLYWHGHDTFFWQHRTDAELAYQRKQLGLDIETHSQPCGGKNAI
jgi:hypothetical protein